MERWCPAEHSIMGFKVKRRASQLRERIGIEP